MKFIDANVFIYAALKPKKVISEPLIKIKRNATEIVKRIEEGERVITSVVHLSEVANVLEDAAGLVLAIGYCGAILSKPNITVLSVDAKQYHLASKLAESKKISLNDALALVLMEERDIREIYTFDSHFSGEWITVVRE